MSDLLDSRVVLGNTDSNGCSPYLVVRSGNVDNKVRGLKCLEPLDMAASFLFNLEGMACSDSELKDNTLPSLGNGTQGLLTPVPVPNVYPNQWVVRSNQEPDVLLADQNGNNQCLRVGGLENVMYFFHVKFRSASSVTGETVRFRIALVDDGPVYTPLPFSWDVALPSSSEPEADFSASVRIPQLAQNVGPDQVYALTVQNLTGNHSIIPSYVRVVMSESVAYSARP